MEAFFRRLWFAQHRPWYLIVIEYSLIPLTWIYAWLQARSQRGAGAKRSLTSPTTSPRVVVVGNLVVGGAGKTPCILGLVRALQPRGLRMGIVSRGYGGRLSRHADAALLLPDQPDPADYGDEPCMLKQKTGLPIAVGRKRQAALELLTKNHPGLDLVFSDDGLQHVGLPRDLELLVFDSRGLGNQRLLPAGPVREPISRLQTIDGVVLNGQPIPQELLKTLSQHHLPTWPMTLRLSTFVALQTGEQLSPTEFLHRHQGQKLAALAGIGAPQRFFDTLSAMGLVFEPHPFPDHHPYCREDFDHLSAEAFVLTEKDAIKCQALGLERTLWVAITDTEFGERQAACANGKATDSDLATWLIARLFRPSS